MLVARRVAVRAAAAAMTSYTINNRNGPVRDDSVYDHPPFALRQMSQTEPRSSDDDGKVAILRRHFPAAPRAELQRFADALEGLVEELLDALDVEIRQEVEIFRVGRGPPAHFEAAAELLALHCLWLPPVLAPLIYGVPDALGGGEYKPWQRLVAAPGHRRLE